MLKVPLRLRFRGEIGSEICLSPSASASVAVGLALAARYIHASIDYWSTAGVLAASFPRLGRDSPDFLLDTSREYETDVPADSLRILYLSVAPFLEAVNLEDIAYRGGNRRVRGYRKTDQASVVVRGVSGLFLKIRRTSWICFGGPSYPSHSRIHERNLLGSGST
jgi:hypothetical protein